MNLTNLIAGSRLYIPRLTVTAISNDQLTLMINNAAVNVAFELVCLKKNKTFNVTAEKSEYILSDEVTDYLNIDESGVYWYDGTQWKKLDSVTRKYLDEEFPHWRDDDSTDPKRYYIDGDIIGFHPTPDTTLTNGFKIYYGRKPQVMSIGDHFPFHKENNQTIEIPNLTVLDDCIFAHIEWRASKILSKDPNENIVLEKVYFQEIERKRALLKRRPDISNNKDARFKGRSFRR